MNSGINFIALATAGMLLASCNAHDSKTNGSTSNPDSTNPPNVVKVLDRVVCSNNITSCPQEVINKIWGICLKNGFSEAMPNREVLSSRDIQDLVSESETITKTRPTDYQTTDENGIVKDVQGEEQYDEEVTTKGVCIGSEYILK
ncbi:hypothetical protein SynPROS71_50020 [Synechococcus sp. PROS-7-1]|uniref:hypothetical protein n=1 Tax=Synechococcus sp. PROS-7-1 TaxID=1442556 RepID=UPI001644E4F1|nr:hypothetical protein [Synechococcus sp. PROS-7-1]QNI86467.1 hypothetical protein SynPROS71_50020 [Synechococcus sp. PROS-7-1]